MDLSASAPSSAPAPFSPTSSSASAIRLLLLSSLVSYLPSSSTSTTSHVHYSLLGPHRHSTSKQFLPSRSGPMKELAGLVLNGEALLLDKYSEYYFFKKPLNPSSTFSPSLFLSLSLSTPSRGDAERGPTTLAREPQTSQAPHPRRYSRRPRPRRPSHLPPPRHSSLPPPPPPH